MKVKFAPEAYSMLKLRFTTTRRLLARLMSDTLFGRPALLLRVAVLASHVLALTMGATLRLPRSG